MVLQDEASRWFGLRPGQESPYMLLVAPVLDEHRIPVTDEQRATMANDPDLRNRVNIPRSTIPAVTHVDYSARVQTVDDTRNPRTAKLLRAFFERTGCPVLVNTSFNVRGEPIVCTPEDAYRCFLGTEMDALVLEDVILLKADVAETLDVSAREKYLAQFQLD
jgi:carbamoyltransferase